MFFPANLLTSTKKTKSKPGEGTTKIHNKPRIMQITSTMQNNHASGKQKTITQNKQKQLKRRFGL